MTTRNPNRCPTHPGELLADIIPETGKTNSEIAQMLGISHQHLYDILNAKNLSLLLFLLVLERCLGMEQAYGYVCKPIMMLGMQSVKQMLAKFRYSTLFDFVT